MPSQQDLICNVLLFLFSSEATEPFRGSKRKLSGFDTDTSKIVSRSRIRTHIRTSMFLNMNMAQKQRLQRIGQEHDRPWREPCVWM